MKSREIPRIIKKWIEINESVIDEYWMERDEFLGESPYSIWVYFKIGWCSEPGLHVIHEGTVKGFMANANVQKCEPSCHCYKLLNKGK